jgi:hypothetical protein
MISSLKMKCSTGASPSSAFRCDKRGDREGKTDSGFNAEVSAGQVWRLIDKTRVIDHQIESDQAVLKQASIKRIVSFLDL